MADIFSQGSMTSDERELAEEIRQLEAKAAREGTGTPPPAPRTGGASPRAARGAVKGAGRAPDEADNEVHDLLASTMPRYTRSDDGSNEGGRPRSVSFAQLRKSSSNSIGGNRLAAPSRASELQNSQNTITRSLAVMALTNKFTPERGAAKAILKLKGLVGRRKALDTQQSIDRENERSQSVAEKLEEVQEDVNRAIQINRTRRSRSVLSWAGSPYSGIDAASDAQSIGAIEVAVDEPEPDWGEDAQAHIDQLELELAERQHQLVIVSELGLQLRTGFEERGRELAEVTQHTDKLEKRLEELDRTSMRLNHELRDLTNENRQLRAQNLFLSNVQEENSKLEDAIFEKEQENTRLNTELSAQRNDTWVAKKLKEQFVRTKEQMKLVEEQDRLLKEKESQIETEIESRASERAKQEVDKANRMRDAAIKAFRRAADEKHAKLVKELEKKTADAVSELAAAQQVLAAKSDEIQRLSSRLAEVQQSADHAQQQIKVVERELREEAGRKLATQVAELSSKLDTKNEEVSARSTEVAETKRVAEDLQRAVESKAKEVQFLKAAAHRAEESVKASEAAHVRQLQSSAEREQSVKNYCEELQEQLAATRADLTGKARDAVQEVSNLKSQLIDHEKAVQEARGTEQSLRADCEGAQRALAQQRAAFDAQIDALTRDRTALDEVLSRTRDELSDTLHKLKLTESDLGRERHRIESERQTVEALQQRLEAREADHQQAVAALQKELDASAEVGRRQNDTVLDEVERLRRDLLEERNRVKSVEEAHAVTAAQWSSLIRDREHEKERAVAEQLVASGEKEKELAAKIAKLRQSCDGATDEAASLKRLAETLKADLLAAESRASSEAAAAKRAAQAADDAERASRARLQQLERELDGLRTELSAQARRPEAEVSPARMSPRWRESVQTIQQQHAASIDALKAEFAGKLEEAKRETAARAEELHAEKMRAEALLMQVNLAAEEASTRAASLEAERQTARARQEEMTARFNDHLAAAQAKWERVAEDVGKSQEAAFSVERGKKELVERHEGELRKLQTSLRDSNDQIQQLQEQVARAKGNVDKEREDSSALRIQMQTQHDEAVSKQSVLQSEIRVRDAAISELQDEIKNQRAEVLLLKESLQLAEETMRQEQQEAMRVASDQHEVQRCLDKARAVVDAKSREVETLQHSVEQLKQAVDEHMRRIDDQKRFSEQQAAEHTALVNALRSEMERASADRKMAEQEKLAEVEGAQRLVDSLKRELSNRGVTLLQDQSNVNRQCSELAEQKRGLEGRERVLQLQVKELSAALARAEKAEAALQHKLAAAGDEQAELHKARAEQQDQLLAAREETRAQALKAAELQGALDEAEAAREARSTDQAHDSQASQSRLTLLAREVDDLTARNRKLELRLQDAASPERISRVDPAAEREQQTIADNLRQENRQLRGDAGDLRQALAVEKQEAARLRQHAGELEAEAQRQRLEEAGLRAEIAQLVAAQRAVVESAEEARADIEAALRADGEQHSSALQQLAAYKEQIALRREEAERSQQQLDNARRDLASATRKLSAAQARQADLEREVQHVKSQLAASNATVAQLENERPDFQRKLNAMRFELDEARDALTISQRREAISKQQVDEGEKDLTATQSKARTLERELSSLRRELEESSALNVTREAESKHSETLRRDAEARVSGAKTDAAKLRAAVGGSEAKLDAMRGELETARHEAIVAAGEIQRLRLRVGELEAQAAETGEWKALHAQRQDDMELKFHASEKHIRSSRDEAVEQRAEAARVRRELDNLKMAHGAEIQSKAAAIARLQATVCQLEADLQRHAGDAAALRQLDDELRKVRAASAETDAERAGHHRDLIEARKSLEHERSMARARVDELREQIRHKEADAAAAASGLLGSVNLQAALAERHSSALRAEETRAQRLHSELAAAEERCAALEGREGRGQRDATRLARELSVEAEARRGAALRLVGLESELINHRSELSVEREARREAEAEAHHESIRRQRALDEVRETPRRPRAEDTLRLELRETSQRVHELEGSLRSARREASLGGTITSASQYAVGVHAAGASSVSSLRLPVDVASEERTNLRKLRQLSSQFEMPASPPRSLRSGASPYRSQSPLTREVSDLQNRMQYVSHVLSSMPSGRFDTKADPSKRQVSPTRQDSRPSFSPASATQSKGPVPETPTSPATAPSFATPRAPKAKPPAPTIAIPGSPSERSGSGASRVPADASPSPALARTSNAGPASAAEQVAAALHGAMQGFGTDEQRVFDQLARVGAERDWVAAQHAFNRLYPKFRRGDLRKALEDELTARELSRAKAILEARSISWTAG
ncbi:hypothetical protein DIPPA_21110 [Diplonema papillatum]|nr:hypothetical protein DIPPA_21110 [Diplonema papillatum]